MIAHDAKFLELTCELKIPITLTEYDKLSNKRIQRLVEARIKQIEKADAAEKARQKQMQEEQRHKEERERARQASEARRMRQMNRNR